MRFQRRVNPFIKAHGAAPGPLMWPKITGIISSGLATSIILLLSSDMEVREKIGSVTSSQYQFYIYFFYTLISGTLYGGIYRRAANDRRGGWIFGASTGFILWMINPLIWLPWFGLTKIFIGKVGLDVLLNHILHGALMGFLFPWVHALNVWHWETKLFKSNGIQQSTP